MKGKKKSVVTIVMVLSILISLFSNGTAFAVKDDTYQSGCGTYTYVEKDETPTSAGTYSYPASANILAFKQANAVVIWHDATVTDTAQDIIDAVAALDSSIFNSVNYSAVVSTTSFFFGSAIGESGPQYQIQVDIDTSAHTYTLSKGVSHVTSISYEAGTGALTVEKEITGENADVQQTFQIDVTFSNVSGITAPQTAVLNGNTYTVTLKGGQSAEFMDIPFETTYEVSEKTPLPNGWSDLTGTVSGTINCDNHQDTVTITNDYEAPEYFGSLSIIKEVTGTGADVDQDFMIDVMFSDDTGIIAPASASYDSGVYTVTLTGNTAGDANAATFTNIPAGTTYTVTEQSPLPDNWINTGTVFGNTDKMITANTTDTVTITNDYDAPEYGALTVNKVVSGYQGDPLDFTITVTFESDDAGINLNNISNTAGKTGVGGVYTLTMQGGDSVTFSNIPVGVSYTVSEAMPLPANWEMTTSANNLTGTIAANVTASATVTNVYTPPEPVYTDLTVTKAVTGTGASTSQEFTINVIFSNGQADLSDIQTTGDVTKVADGEYTVSLHDGENAVFSMIPMGTQYTVVESTSLPSNWAYVSGNVVAEDNMILDEGNTSDSVTITNNYTPPVTTLYGSLSVTKAVTGTGASTTQEFTMTVAFANNASLAGIQTSGDVTKINNNTYTVSLHDGEVANFTQIPMNTTYTVVETGAMPMNWAYVSGEVSTDDAALLTYTNRSDSVTITNRYTPPVTPPDYGVLNVTKSVTNLSTTLTPDPNEAFEITVQFMLGANGSYSDIKNDSGMPVSASGEYTFTLIDGQAIQFSNIPMGTTYTVTEVLTIAQGDNGWFYVGTEHGTGTIENVTPILVTVNNEFDAELLGDTDTEDDNELPATGGIALSTLLGLLGVGAVLTGAVLNIQSRRKTSAK